ncbi:DUF998 domain-containing protein [Mycolicibacterium neworleansense]|uniref:DUF998 domain-containing protein n=1 Tax=Mycolicibacterium neworleansense TaxID=146018 RepID=A0A0H5RKX6_9MYCO|nr:DUF998 domain-containing protein [Mycolicibacterium neworleansense]MCV7361073.1 DUF998 domain-containing protein [Mycolicibacterium neworleansense]CRZ14157.1 hypothetical protein BN2156_01005 [Mycolicibacterium neworleansense]
MTPDARPAATRLTNALLAAGVLGGLLITTVSIALALTRPGFDPARHANSLLVLGDWGWVQTTNFIVCGLLLIALGAGVWRAASGVWSGRVAGVCVVLYGLLAGVVVGLNPTDPGFGFPPGAPQGYPGVDGLSASARIHGAAGGLGFLAATCGCFALARYFTRCDDRVWAVLSVAVGVAVASVGAYMGLNAGAQTEAFNYVPTWISGGVLWLFIAAVAARLWRSHRHAHVGAQ